MGKASDVSPPVSTAEDKSVKHVLPPVPTAEDMEAIRAVKAEDLPWMPPPPVQENKFLMRMKENPFVPIGCLATVMALTFGLVQFKRGNSARSQLAMRLRVFAQGGTVIALMLGVMWSSRKKDNQK